MITIGRFKVEGASETASALRGLPRAAARNILKRSLTRSAQSLAASMRTYAPDDPKTAGKHDLKTVIAISSRLNKRQQRLERRDLRETGQNKDFAVVYVGPTTFARHGVLLEFGTHDTTAQPFAQPAWNQEGPSILPNFARYTWSEIDAQAKRSAAKALRAARK